MNPTHTTDRSPLHPQRRSLFWLVGSVLALALLYLAVGASSWAQPSQTGLRQTVMAEIDGQVSLQGRPNPPHARWQTPLTVVLDRADDPHLYTRPVTTDQEGGFTLANVGTGLYTGLTVKGSHTLRVRLNNVPITQGVNPLDFGVLPEGDANDDNTINAIDASILASSYWKGPEAPGFAPNANFNEDDYIDARDASLLATNYWQSGAPALTGGAVSLQQALPQPRATLPPPQPFADLLFSPLTGTASVGSVLTMTVEIDSQGRLIQAADIFVRFDPRYLAVVDEQGNPATTVIPIYTDMDSFPLANLVDPVTGLISYAIMETDPYTPTQNVRLFQIPFKIVAATGSDGTPVEFLFDQETPRMTRLCVEGYDVLRQAYAGNVVGKGNWVMFLPLVYNERDLSSPPR